MASRGPTLLAVEALYEYAVGALGRRSLTAVELRSRLQRRAAHEEDVEEVVGRLADVGYLDDANLAESYSRFRRQYEALGPKRVLRELERRGVDAGVAEGAVEQAYQDVDEAQLIRAHLRRKLGKNYRERPVTDPKHIARLYRGLIRAGFASDKIVEALQEIASDSEWLEGFADQTDEAFD